MLLHPRQAIAASAELAKAFFSAPTPGAVIDTPAAVADVPTPVAKTAGAVIGTPMPVAKNMKVRVAKKAKVMKESAPVMADVAALAKVVSVPVPVAKAKVSKQMCLVLFILLGWWWRLLGWRWVLKSLGTHIARSPHYHVLGHPSSACLPKYP
jgi:hypothetical protein